jgi:hypothetical protein
MNQHPPVPPPRLSPQTQTPPLPVEPAGLPAPVVLGVLLPPGFAVLCGHVWGWVYS